MPPLFKANITPHGAKRMINPNFIILAILACLWAVQAATLSAWLLKQLPLSPTVLPIISESLVNVRPKWDLTVYAIFIATAIGAYVSACFFCKEQLKTPRWWRSCLSYLSAEAIVSFLLISAMFKTIIYDNSPMLASRAMWGMLIAAVLIKVFWVELVDFKSRIKLRPLPMDAIAFALIALLIYMPDLDRVLALMFIGEQFHHFDFFVMSPGWGALKGHLPYVDTISQYGVGVPVVWPAIAKALTGSFDYHSVLRVMVVFVILYYFGVYRLLRYWLGSAMLAMIGFLILFRLQMFHTGVSPLVWIYPSTTPLRFGLDIVCLGLLLMHLRTANLKILMLAAAIAGLGPFYMTSTGACLLATFYVYLAISFFQQRHKWQVMAATALIPIVMLLVALFLSVGASVVNIKFWANIVEYINFFAHGHAGGVLPMYESLKYRHYWIALMAFFLPLFYTAALCTSSALVYIGKAKPDHIFIAVLAVYGLLNFQYYVVRSALTSYYMNALPFVFIALFVFYLFLQKAGTKMQQRLKAAALLAALYALLTNHNFISYPNIVNFSRNPMTDIAVAQRYPDRQGYFHHLVKYIKEEDKLPVNALGHRDEGIRTEESFKSDDELTQAYLKEFDFKEDAQLIRAYFPEQQPVALISSFETKILMQADRAPLFYHFPLISSQPMTMRSWPNDAAHSPRFLKDTLDQLESAKPQYVFVHKIFIQEQIPFSYSTANGNIVAIMAYIRTHYLPVKEGKYLVMMQRRK